MTKSFCDRCNAETTGVQSAHVMGIDDANENGDGTITKSADLCVHCYEAWLDWLKSPAWDAYREDARAVDAVAARSSGSAHPSGGDRE
jgi:hypothetical protein